MCVALFLLIYAYRSNILSMNKPIQRKKSLKRVATNLNLNDSDIDEDLIQNFNEDDDTEKLLDDITGIDHIEAEPGFDSS
ncbi:hypothetical protein QE152_g15363 [Popillia japonica]|uniref:Uncharacterized protein n=1 Tax=Popillia japonica TaxID=7064 RepID=A0AAW1L9R7_POPJA